MAITPTAGTAELWHTERTRADVNVLSATFPLSSQRLAGWGLVEGRLDEGGAQRVNLPSDSKKLVLTLDRGLVAALADCTTVLSVHSGGDEAVVETVTTMADTLMVLAGSDGGRWAADLVSAEELPPLGAASPLALTASHSGRLRLAVAGNSGERTLHLAGAATAASFVGDDGRVVRGATALDLGASAGALTLSHGSGLALAWFGPRDEPARGLWPPDDQRPDALKLPADVPLSGARASFRVAADEASVLSLTLTSPCLLRVTSTDSAARHFLLLSPGSRHLAVAAGTVEVALAGIGDASLGGVLAATATPLLAAGEGLGEAILLAPGTARGFRFTVAAAGKVGVGLRADPDTVEATLFDSTGRELGHGVVQLHELEPGAYVLVAAVPAGSAPVTVRPALVGLEAPATGPPDEVIRTYVESNPEMEGER